MKNGNKGFVENHLSVEEEFLVPCFYKKSPLGQWRQGHYIGTLRGDSNVIVVLNHDKEISLAVDIKEVPATRPMTTEELRAWSKLPEANEYMVKYKQACGSPSEFNYKGEGEYTCLKIDTSKPMSEWEVVPMTVEVA